MEINSEVVQLSEKIAQVRTVKSGKVHFTIVGSLRSKKCFTRLLPRRLVRVTTIVDESPRKVLRPSTRRVCLQMMRFDFSRT